MRQKRGLFSSEPCTLIYRLFNRPFNLRRSSNSRESSLAIVGFFPKRRYQFNASYPNLFIV